MTGNNVFNISQQTPKVAGMTPRNRAIMPNLPENGIIQAIIAKKDANATALQLENGDMLNIRQNQGVVDGNVGDKVFFEVSRGSEGGFALRQVFPDEHQQNLLTSQFSLKGLQDLMAHKDYIVKDESPGDVAAFAQERAALAQKANEAVARLSRSINRIAGNTHSAAVAELAAQGINIDKIPIHLLDSVTSRLDAAKAANAPRVFDELGAKLDAIMNLSDNQIARMLSHGAELTLDNLYAYKNSGYAELPNALSDAEWQNLQADVAKFFAREGLELTDENLAKARFLLENGIALDAENFGRLVFLTDLDANIDTDAVLAAAVDTDADGKPIGGVDAYQPDKVKQAEIRLMMSYEANLGLIGTDLEMDLTPQIEAMKQLKERAAELFAALNEVQADNADNRRAMLDTFRSVFTLPFVNFDTFAAVANNGIDFTPQGLAGHVTAMAYEANATVASLKYGDTFAKITEQIAPLLAGLGLPTDEDSVRAAKILTMNGMDVDAENLLTIKDMAAKISHVETHLHPRMAAQMISEGLNPAAMHIDEILEHMAKYDNEFGTNDADKLARHIVEMDKAGDVDAELRAKVIEIYQMLHKISKNSGAGIGYAVNAGINLTLENLMDFSKNYNNTSGNRRNTINYAAQDGTFYAKQLISSFISSAKPKPLTQFVATEPLTDHLATSVDKLDNIATQMAADAELDIARINQSIQELSGASRENMRFLTSIGVPVTAGNIRQLRQTKERNLGEELNVDVLGDADSAVLLEGLQGTDLEGYAQGATPADLNEALLAHIDGIRENAADADKITKLDIVMQNLNFRGMMLENNAYADFSCAMRFNGRLADVAMFVVNDDMDLGQGVSVYLSLKTAMGEVLGLVKLSESKAEVTFAAQPQAADFMQQNVEFLADLMQSIGIEDFDVKFVENGASGIKNQLSNAAFMPI